MGMMEDIYYMEWEDVMDHFETLYMANKANDQSYKTSPQSQNGAFRFTMENTGPLTLTVFQQQEKQADSFSNVRIMLFHVW
jgi:hypothetical protein